MSLDIWLDIIICLHYCAPRFGHSAVVVVCYVRSGTGQKRALARCLEITLTVLIQVSGGRNANTPVTTIYMHI